MDIPTGAFLSTALQQAPRGLLVEIGSRNVNGTILQGLPAGFRYIGTDIAHGDNVDVVTDGAETPFEDGSVDVVVCSSVFEHTPVGDQICREVFRILRPMGWFIVTTVDERWPVHSAIHGGALRPEEYYGAVSECMLRAWLAGFPVLSLEVTHRGDLFAVAAKTGIGYVYQPPKPRRPADMSWVTCKQCNRVLYTADADGAGLCVDCRP